MPGPGSESRWRPGMFTVTVWLAHDSEIVGSSYIIPDLEKESSILINESYQLQ